MPVNENQVKRWGSYKTHPIRENVIIKSSVSQLRTLSVII
jgi:hypothetical protein